MDETGRIREGVRDAIRTLHTLEHWRLSAEDINDLLTTLAVAHHHLILGIGRLAYEADDRDTPETLGYHSAAGLMANTAPLSFAQAAQLAKRGHTLETITKYHTGYAQVRDAYQAGDIPAPHADLIAAFLVRYRNRIPDDDTRAAVVGALIGFGTGPDTKALKDALTRLGERLDDTGDKPDPSEDRDLDSLHFSALPNGRHQLTVDMNKI